MWCALSYYLFELKKYYDMYKCIYQFLSFQFNSNLMLWWEETVSNVRL